MKVQVKEGTRWRFFVALANGEDGKTIVQSSLDEGEARTFLKREEAESVLGFIAQESPDLKTRIVNQ